MMTSSSSTWPIWLFCVSLLKCFQPGASDGCIPSPMEEGKTGTLTCSAPIAARNLTWLLRKGGVYITVATCNTHDGCTNYFATFAASAQNSSSGTEYQSLFTISRVNRNESTFKCVADGVYGEIECQIEVYVIPESPSCNPLVVYSTSEVAISCNTTRVYPEALCLFSYLAQSSPLPIVGPVTYKKEPSPTSPGDISTTCTFVMNVTGFTPGSFQLSLSMFPKLSQVPKSAVVASSTDSIVILKAPSVVLADDCPNGPSINSGYIDARDSSKTTCRCVLDDQGVPTGHAAWMNNSGSTLGITNSTDRSSILTLSYIPSDPSPSYTCYAATVLETSADGVIFKPKYAAGPNTVLIELSDQAFNLCPSNKQNITVTCSTTANEVSPGATFSVLVDSQTSVTRQSGEWTSSGYRFFYSFRPLTGGNSVITCRAENSLLLDVQAKVTATLSIKEPPKSDPSIHMLVKGTELYNLKAPIKVGANIEVICLVDGGFPLVQSVALQCGDKRQESQGNRAILTMTATRNMTGQICYCNAVHVTNCYDRVSQIVIIVATDDSGTSAPVNHDLIIGLSAGIGAAAVVCLVLVALVVWRRKRRGASHTPTYFSEGKNHKHSQQDIFQENSISGFTRYVVRPSHPPPEPPSNDDYAEIIPSSDYVIEDDYISPLPGIHKNAAFLGDYITPLQ